MDDADRARKFQEQDLQRALDNIPQRPRLPYTGTCYWCLAPVGPRQRFCNSQCSRDWEIDEQLQQEERARG